MSTLFDPIQSVGLSGLLKYRRPNLVYASANQVTVESGLNGISGNATILFPDGQLRTDTSVPNGKSTMTITQNAILSGVTQGGLRTGLTATNNTWYATYAVKATDNNTDWVLVSDTLLPLQTNFTTLNTNFGTNGWQYLGLIRYGNNADVSPVILQFVQHGNMTYCFGSSATNVTFGTPINGINLVNASAASVTFNFSTGTTGTAIPNNIDSVKIQAGIGAVANSTMSFNFLTGARYTTASTQSGFFIRTIVDTPIATTGFSMQNTVGSVVGLEANIVGWTDTVLGVGSNPLL